MRVIIRILKLAKLGQFQQFPEPSVWTIKNGQISRVVVAHAEGLPDGVANLLQQIGVSMPGM